MSYRDRLRIIIRILGVYFLWQVMQTILLVVSIGLSEQRESQASGLLNLFSGGTTGAMLMIRGMSAYILIQGFLSIWLIAKPKIIAEWLTKDIPDTNEPLLPQKTVESIALTLQIIGLVLFGAAVRSSSSVIPSLFVGSEQPFTTPIFLIYCGQIILAALLVFRARTISRLIQRYTT